MDSETHQSFLQYSEEGPDSRNPGKEPDMRNRVEQGVFNLKNHKSIVILKSALKNITSNPKCMFLMILSTIPLLAFMVIYECNIQKIVAAISELVVQPSHTYYYDFDLDKFIFHDESYQSRKGIRSLLQIVPFHMVFTPFIELFSITMITRIAAKVHEGEKEITLKEVFYQKDKVKGPLITCILVQLLSTSNIVGLFWTLANYYILSTGLYFEYYLPRNIYMNALLIMFHAMFFMGFLYKFLDWSAIWNMGIVISVLEDDMGVDALEVSGYCRMHSKQTGFQLMLLWFVYSVVVRMPLLLLEEMYYSMNVEIMVTLVVLVLFCLGNLVKWVALVLYYYECKALIFLKKVDEEMGKVVKAGQL